ncbi:general substrate transporter [Fomitiporia mediterranea MF3/22]|uniref:general substrate transporter n=1 Tax=Fomitiporia mediterranea (strain MF3/22) TaxID=694068 RepID=UPI00044082FF|nr:general substrate transporter [Fomitiporia mediterranea MF3/22]EJD04873.1 general substrate transporter [Fomitiporia mediterranea MF3/22]
MTFAATPITESSKIRKTPLRDNVKCLIFCLMVAVSNFQYGFDTGIVNGFQAMQGFLRVYGVRTSSGQFTIEKTFQQLITSLLQVGLIISSVANGPLSARYGRRMSFAVASVLGCAGITIQILVTSQWPVYIGRLLLGLSNGLYVNATVLYISEIAPPHLRGLMVSIFQPFVNLGSFIGAVISNAFSENLAKISYQAQLCILYAVPVWLFFVVWLVPESPRWLLVNEKRQDADRSLVRLRPKGTAREEIEEEIRIIEDAIAVEKEMETDVAWTDIWKGTDLRRTLLCIACSTFHAASGLNFLVGYGTFFFQVAGASDPFIDTVILQSVNLFTSLCALPLARRFGRRTLLLSGFGMETVSMLAVALIYSITRTHTTLADGKALVAMLCIFSGAYGATIGPLSWVTAGEMTANRLRSHAFGVSMAIGFFFAWLTVFTTPYFINTTGLNWGAKVAWIWMPSNLVTFVFIYFFLPETRGRSLEELDELFNMRIPARKFSSVKLRPAAIESNDEKTSNSELIVDIEKVS